MEYSRDGEKLTYSYSLDQTDSLDFIADNIRLEKTGVHAEVAVKINNKVLLGSDVFNLSRLDPRQRLANRVLSQLNGNGTPLLDKGHINNLMDEFCLNLWDEFSKDSLAEMLDVDGELTTPDFIVPPFILGNGAGTIIYGEPGKGKSWLGLLIAQSISTNTSKIWNVAPDKRCLFVNLERDEEGMRRRIRAVNRSLGLPVNHRMLMINRKGWTLERVMNSIERSIREFEIDIIVLDSISRAGVGLTNDEDANKIMDTLNGFGVSWIGIAHSPKGNTETLFGSQMFYASADVVCQLDTQERYEENKLGISIQITKANDVPKTHMPLYAIEFDQFGMVDVREAMEMEFPDLSEFALSHAEKIREYLKVHGEGDAASIGHAVGVHRSTVSGILANNSWFEFINTGGRSKNYKLTSIPEAPF